MQKVEENEKLGNGNEKLEIGISKNGKLENEDELCRDDFSNMLDYFEALREKDLGSAQVKMYNLATQYTDKELADLWEVSKYKVSHLRFVKLGITKPGGTQPYFVEPGTETEADEVLEGERKSRNPKTEMVSDSDRGVLSYSMSGEFTGKSATQWLKNLILILKENEQEKFDIYIDIEMGEWS